MDFQVTWTDSPSEFGRRLRSALAGGVPGPIRRAMGDIALEIERRAKQNAPVDTGTLRASIASTVEELGGQAIAAIVGSPVEYAGFVELGTVYMGAQPYLRPAIREASSFIRSRLESAVSEVFMQV